MAEYIEREKAIEAFDDPTVERYYGDICPESVIRVIEQIPTADVRPVVRGKWIPVGTDDMDEGMYKCSECGSEHFFPDILLGIPADNFCPNCGADMREPPKEE